MASRPQRAGDHDEIVERAASFSGTIVPWNASQLHSCEQCVTEGPAPPVIIGHLAHASAAFFCEKAAATVVNFSGRQPKEWGNGKD